MQSLGEFLNEGCSCGDCNKTRAEMARLEEEARKAKEADEANRQKHLANPFYQRAHDYREQERIGQILKGAAKYKEPFNPESWTAKELLQHAVQENVDQGHYLYGLYELLEAMEEENKYLDQKLAEMVEFHNQEIGRRDNQIKTLEAYYELYKKDAKRMGSLTTFLVNKFPNEGVAGDHCADLAIEILKKQSTRIAELEKDLLDVNNAILTAGSR